MLNHPPFALCNIKNFQGTLASLPHTTKDEVKTNASLKNDLQNILYLLLTRYGD